MKAPDGSTSRALEIKPPSAATLKKYGLDADQWLAILASQGNVCAICRKVPTTGRWVTDHYHAPKYKTFSADRKRRCVRGICCWWCNKTFLGRGITVERALAVVGYLTAYANRIAGQVSQ